jgi:hypothetical protein
MIQTYCKINSKLHAILLKGIHFDMHQLHAGTYQNPLDSTFFPCRKSESLMNLFGFVSAPMFVLFQNSALSPFM